MADLSFVTTTIFTQVIPKATESDYYAGILGQVASVVSTITFDAVLRERHLFEWEPSEVPIEDGSYASEHIRRKPNEVMLFGKATDTPTGTGLMRFVPGAGALMSSLGRAKRDILDALLELADSKTPFDLQTGLHLYTDLVFTRIQIMKDRPVRSYDFEANCRFLQIIKSTGESINTADSDSTRKKALSNYGIQTPTEYIG